MIWRPTFRCRSSKSLPSFTLLFLERSAVSGLISELVGELLLQHGNEWLKDRERERGGRKNFWTCTIPLQFAARS